MANHGSRYRAELRLTARTVLAACLSLLVAETLGLPQSYWAVVTALLVVQVSLGGTIAAGMDRIAGTVAGAGAGVLAALLGQLAGANPTIVALPVIAPLALLGAVRPNFRLAPVTAVIVLLASSTDVPPLLSAVHRVVEIALGTAIGIAVSLFFLPSRARRISTERSAELLRLLGEVLAIHLQPPFAGKEQAVSRLNDRSMAELGKISSAAGEARRERAIRLAGEPSQDRLFMALRRLRNDVAYVGRATAGAGLDWQLLGPVLAEIATAYRDILDGLAQALESRKPVPALAAADRATERLATVLGDGPGQSRGILALPFVLDALRHNVEDVATFVAMERA